MYHKRHTTKAIPQSQRAMATVTIVNGEHGAYRIKDHGIDESECKTISLQALRHSRLINSTDQVILTPGADAFKVVRLCLGNGGPRALLNMTIKVKNGTPTVIFPLEKQEICYEWNQRANCWVLGDNAALFGVKRAALNNVVKDILAPAPFSTNRKTTLINYATDTLFFECDLCGGEEEHEQYCTAMQEAADLVEAINTDPATQKIHHLKMSFCTDLTYVSSILDLVKKIPHIKSVTLIGHSHFGLRQLEDDAYHSFERDQGELKGELGNLEKYKFVTRLLNNLGEEIVDDGW